ncbi:MAG: hypothetical protein ACI86H_000120 [bacterium]|jgi:hypothetical protein
MQIPLKALSNIPFSQSTCLRFLVAIFLIIILTIQGNFDPTPYNLVWPLNGIENWFGLVGAIISGFLLENFGFCAFLIPISLLFLSFQKKLSKGKRIFSCILMFLLFPIFIALLFPHQSDLIIQYAGFWGYSANSILIYFPSRYLALPVIGVALFYLSQRLSFHFSFIHFEFRNLPIQRKISNYFLQKKILYQEKAIQKAQRKEQQLKTIDPKLETIKDESNTKKEVLGKEEDLTTEIENEFIDSKNRIEEKEIPSTTIEDDLVEEKQVTDEALSAAIENDSVDKKTKIQEIINTKKIESPENKSFEKELFHKNKSFEEELFHKNKSFEEELSHKNESLKEALSHKNESLEEALSHKNESFIEKQVSSKNEFEEVLSNQTEEEFISESEERLVSQIQHSLEEETTEELLTPTKESIFQNALDEYQKSYSEEENDYYEPVEGLFDDLVDNEETLKNTEKRK